MIDPLADVVLLLQPQAVRSKVVSGGGAWRVERPASDNPFYCVVLDGSARIAADGHEPIDLEAGDFVLIPAALTYVMSGHAPAAAGEAEPSTVTFLAEEVRHGVPSGPANARLLIGHLAFGSPDAALLVALLPRLIHIRGEPRLSTIVQLIVQEARDQRPARAVILARLLEVMLIEALRASGTAASPGLLRGLADTRLADALRRIHESPAEAWTISRLAREAGLSRSAFFDRFNRAMGMAPMEYLLSWRMALAKNLLRAAKVGTGEIAARVGYSSASTFSVAFTRFVGLSPTRFSQSLPAPQTLISATE
jgi:AraC-like DNA-binding protein